MTKISLNNLRKAIKTAEANRLKLQLPFRPKSPKLDKSRKAAESAISNWMTASGLDLNRLQTMHEQRDAELLRLAAAHKKEALRLAAQQKKLKISTQSDALAALAGNGFFPNPTFTLDTPFLIWTTPLMAIESSAAPFNSWAKFKYLTSQTSGTQKVSFYFYWLNQFTDYAVINATTYLSASGYLRAHAPWGLSVNTSEVDTWAGLGLWFGTFGDLNYEDYVADFFGITGAYGSFFTGGDVESKTVSFGSTLSRTMFAVPPGNLVIFEVAVGVDYDNESGNIEADFQSGSFQIACPLVIFSLLNSPPGGPVSA